MTISDYFDRKMSEKVCRCGGRGPYLAIAPIVETYEPELACTRLRSTVHCDCCNTEQVVSVLCFSRAEVAGRIR